MFLICEKEEWKLRSRGVSFSLQYDAEQLRSFCTLNLHIKDRKQKTNQLTEGGNISQNITITVSADGSLTVDGKKVLDTNISMIDSRKPYILPSTGGPGRTRTVLAYALFAGICGLMAASAFKTNKKKQRD